MKLHILTLSAIALTVTAGHASVVAYNSNPTGNSTDFASGVAANSGVMTTLTFEGLTDGAFTNPYAGVTISSDKPTLEVGSGYVPSCNNQGSTGEGCYNPSSKFLWVNDRAPYNGYHINISFDAPVLAAGFFIIDMYNPAGVHQIEAFDGPDGTGSSIAVVPATAANFQLGYRYFIGLLSTTSNIRSIVYSSPEPAGDTVYLDDLKYATVAESGPSAPEPGTLALLALPLAGFLLRRRSLTR
ncbi:MAG: PEP-CTERM sorting domain-containing protein [Candidatus Solibacter sp.]